MNAKQILALWPSRSAVADDTGRSLEAVHNWIKRNRIPADAFVPLADAASSRGLKVSLREIAQTRMVSGVEDAR